MGLVNFKWLFVAAVACAPLVHAAHATDGDAPRERIAWLWDGVAAPSWSAQHAAVLVSHIHLTGSEVRRRWRHDNPGLGAGARVTPVVHVELSTVRPPLLTDAARRAVVDAVMQASAGSSSGWVQLDMEARPSQRAFYLGLVRELRARLPHGTKLSVTALAWWCRSPHWLDELAADEVVPMVFRMGGDTARIRETWLSEPGRLHPRCRAGAIGTGAAEPLPDSALARYTKQYIFPGKEAP